MRSFCFCIIFVLTGLHGKCQEAMHIDSLFRSLNTGDVSISERPLYFSDFATLEVEDTLWHLVGDNIPGINIGYGQVKREKYACDMIQVNNRNYRLFADDDDDKKFDMEMKTARLFHLSAKGRKFVCITGSNIYQERGGKKTSSFVLLDITDPNRLVIAQLISYNSSIYSLGDLNNDGELDFIQVKPEKGKKMDRAEACDLDGNPIISPEGERYFLLLSAEEDKFSITERIWF